MLSGERAFHGDSAADTMSAILMKEPPDLSASDSDIPVGLDRIVRHCLEKNPGERFYSAHDLAFDLEALSDIPAAASGARTVRREPAGRRRKALGLAGIIAAALLVVAAALLWRARGGKTGASSAAAPGRKSVAVLPFQNLSPDPENAFFADGMTEDILTQLAKIRDLKVISHSSVMRYKGTQKPIQTIASELGVATVLEGSVRRAGNRVRIVGQLKDVFAIQSEVAQRIATALKATLSPAEKKRIEQSPTQNLAAYDLYLKGRELYNRYRKADNEAAIDLFQKALELDSTFALGYRGAGRRLRPTGRALRAPAILAGQEPRDEPEGDRSRSGGGRGVQGARARSLLQGKIPGIAGRDQESRRDQPELRGGREQRRDRAPEHGKDGRGPPLEPPRS